MANQPTATAFTRTQESWALHVLKKIDSQIEEKEQFLINERGWDPATLPDDDELLDLYDDALFYQRYADEMKKQREYIKDKWGVPA